MRSTLPTILLAGSAILVLSGVPADAKTHKGKLTGYQEVPPVSSPASGSCTAKVSKEGTSIDVELVYSGLEGAIQQAHIHFGQAGVNGGIALFLCTNLGNGPAGTPPCPASPSTVTRTLVAADVVGPSAQGIDAGSLEEVLAAMKARASYCNVHTTSYPGGEIRTQLK